MSLDECRALVRACKAGTAAYMMAENLSATPRWFSMAAVAGYLPDLWKNPPAAEILDFDKLVRGRPDAPFGIHEAMDMTLPGLISQQSVREDGRWLPVPDSRDW